MRGSTALRSAIHADTVVPWQALHEAGRSRETVIREFSRAWEPMTSPPNDELPRYDRPPVSEVVMSVQFDPMTALTPVHLGAWWTADRKRKYPLCEERPPLASQREEFETR